MQGNTITRMVTILLMIGSIYSIIPSETATACSSTCECWCEYKYTRGALIVETIFRGGPISVGTVDVDGGRTGWLGIGGDCKPDNSLDAARLCSTRKWNDCVDIIKTRHSDKLPQNVIYYLERGGLYEGMYMKIYTTYDDCE